MKSLQLSGLATLMGLAGITAAIPTTDGMPIRHTDMETRDLAGPKPADNATHMVALTNNLGRSEPRWIYLPRDWNSTGSDVGSLTPKRFIGPSYVNVYVAATMNDNCQSSFANQFYPQNTPCECLIPFGGDRAFNEIFVPSEVQGFIVNIYGGNGLGNCNTYVDQLYQYVGCFYQNNMIGIAFFSSFGC